MNIVNEMISSRCNKAKNQAGKSRTIQDVAVKNKSLRSWQVLFSLLLLLGISAPSYTIWLNKTQETNRTIIAADLAKPVPAHSYESIINKPTRTNLVDTGSFTMLDIEDIEAAKKTLNNTLLINPNHVNARIALAGIYVKANKFTNAKEVLEKGIIQIPQASVFYQWLARFYMERAQFKKATEVLLSGRKYAKDGEYFALLALAQQNTPDFKNAILSYRQALRYKPSESKWWLGLGIVHEKANNWKAAQEAYLAALKPESLPYFLHTQTNERLHFVKSRIALTKMN